MQSPEQRLEQVLEGLRHAGMEQPIGEQLWPELASLLGDPALARLLTARVAALDEAAVDSEAAEQQLLHYLLEEARRDEEDDRARGAGFLAAVGEALDGLDPQAVSDAGSAALTRAYHRAGVAVPAALQALEQSRLAAAMPPQEAGGKDLAARKAEFAQSLEEMRERFGGDAWALYRAISESIASLPDDQCGTFVHEIVGWDDPVWPHLAVYGLLDARDALAEAAAAALAARAQRGRLAADVAGRLAWVRNLLPVGPVRRDVDAALAAYSQRNREWSALPDSGRISEAYASLPDGAGAQYMTLATDSAAGRDWSMVLFKCGHGIRDAYVLEGLEEAAGQEVWDSLTETLDFQAVSRSTALALLAAALEENLEIGQRPPAGLLDVAVTTGLADLRPAPTSGRDWLGVIDPDERLTGLTPQKRGRLINRSADWVEAFPMLASWFEDSTAVSAVLKQGDTPEQNERGLRQHLATRRDWWAELCLRGALAVGDADRDALADSMAVTGLALLEGRELKRIPLIESIVAVSITAYQGRAKRGDAKELGERGAVTESPATERSEGNSESIPKKEEAQTAEEGTQEQSKTQVARMKPEGQINPSGVFGSAIS